MSMNTELGMKRATISFKKQTTYGDTWTGFVQGNAVFTIKRTYSYAKSGGFVYSLYRFGSDVVLDVSCRLQDVTRRARGIAGV